MRTLLRHALIIAAVVAACPATAHAQRVSVDSLLRRIETLEARVQALEGRRAVAPVVRATAIAGPDAWRDVQAWRRLRRGMSADEVRAILGEPTRVSAGVVSLWTYGTLAFGGTVTIADDGVLGWDEPSR